MQDCRAAAVILRKTVNSMLARLSVARSAATLRQNQNGAHIMRNWKPAVLALLMLAGAAQAGPRKIVEPLAPGIVANLQVKAVEVAVSEPARATFDKLEAIAAEKRKEAKLPPFDAATAAPNPPTGEYPTLPFAAMFPLVMQQVTREWGLDLGRLVRLKVTVDTLKTANAGMAMLGGSFDQLAGLVDIVDAESAEPLGSFYIDVINGHGGLLGLAMRGTGVRESLAGEFALESSRVLTGRKSKKRKAGDPMP